MIILLRLLINAGALLAISYYIPGINVDTFYIALISAIILGILNISIKPIVHLLTFPITILTLGLFSFVINALFFWFVASFVQGFAVDGFTTAFIGAFLMTIVSWITSRLLDHD